MNESHIIGFLLAHILWLYYRRYYPSRSHLKRIIKAILFIYACKPGDHQPNVYALHGRLFELGYKTSVIGMMGAVYELEKEKCLWIEKKGRGFRDYFIFEREPDYFKDHD